MHNSFRRVWSKVAEGYNQVSSFSSQTGGVSQQIIYYKVQSFCFKIASRVSTPSVSLMPPWIGIIGLVIVLVSVYIVVGRWLAKVEHLIQFLGKALPISLLRIAYQTVQNYRCDLGHINYTAKFSA